MPVLSASELRAKVEKYFPPELVDKALYVIQHESGGNSTIRGDNGVAIGLFQIQDGTRFPGRPSAEWLSDPDNNIRYAAEVLGAASGNWAPWGEGVTYNGQKFGALGNNPYPGDDGSGMAGDPKVIEAIRRYQTLQAKYSRWADSDGETPALTEDEYRELANVTPIWEAYQSDLSSGGSSDDMISKYRFWNETDPRRIDAENQAAEYAAELEQRQLAASVSANLLREANDMQKAAVADRADYMKVDAGGALIRRPGGSMVPQLRVPTGEELFDRSLAKIKENLPAVPKLPYAAVRPESILTTGAGQESLAARVAASLGYTGNPGAGGTSVIPPNSGGSTGPEVGGGRRNGLLEDAEGTAAPYTPRAPSLSSHVAVSAGRVGNAAMTAPTPPSGLTPAGVVAQAQAMNFAQRVTGSLFGNRYPDPNPPSPYVQPQPNGYDVVGRGIMSGVQRAGSAFGGMFGRNWR